MKLHFQNKKNCCDILFIYYIYTKKTVLLEYLKTSLDTENNFVRSSK